VLLNTIAQINTNHKKLEIYKKIKDTKSSKLFLKPIIINQHNYVASLYFQYQWTTNNGKCGICGDPYDAERENEAGGKYATGLISAHYKTGQTIDIAVQITANHLGWFEFRLCDNNNPKKAATPECLDKYLLQLADGSGTR
jgi:uncharacterized protein (DUF608 family)